MKSQQQRELVAKRVRELDEHQLREIGNWIDLEMLGGAVHLNLIDVDDDEIFQTSPEEFECLATLYITLTPPEDKSFEETFLATVRGAIDGQTATIDSVQIDTGPFAGEATMQQ
jgi:hypothetical protein